MRIGGVAAGWLVLVSTLAAVTVVVPGGTASAADSIELGSDGFRSIVPARVLDTRPGESTIDGESAGTGVVAAGATVQVRVADRGGVPADAVAVSLNVTASRPDGAGFVTVWPCGEQRPLASSLNYGVGHTVPNAVISKIGMNGEICLYTLAAAHLIVDVNGAFAPGSGFASLVPARLLDTRSGESTVDGEGAGTGPSQGGSMTQVRVAGRGGVDQSASAVSLNVTVTGPAGPGFVTVWPCGEPRPLASNVNYAVGQTVPNAVISRVGAGGAVCLFTLATTDLIVDVNGAFAAGSGFAGLVPARLLDTRPGESTVDGESAGSGRAAAGSITTLRVAGRGGVTSAAAAVALNVTAVGAAGPGFVTVWPCDQPQPLASNLNYAGGQTVPNAVISRLSGDGSVCLFTLDATDLIVDVTGVFGGAWTMNVTPAVGTLIVDAEDVVGVTGGSQTGGTVTLAAGMAPPATGGQIAIVPGFAVPSGLVGAVTAVTPQPDGAIVVSFAPIELDAAFTTMEYRYSGPLTPLTSGASPFAGAALQEDVDCGGHVAPSFDVDFTGGDFDVDFGLFDPSAMMRLDGQIQMGFVANTSASFSCTLTFPGLVFVVPFTTIEASPVITVQVGGELTMATDMTFPFQLGFAIDSSGIDNLSSFDATGNADADSSVAVTASLGAGVASAFKLLGVAGATVSLTGNVTASTAPQLVPCAEVGVNATLDFGFELGRWGIDWSFSIATVNTPKITIYRKVAGCPNAVDAWVGTIGYTVDESVTTAVDYDAGRDATITSTSEIDFAWQTSSDVTSLLTAHFQSGDPNWEYPSDVATTWNYHQRNTRDDSHDPVFDEICGYSGGRPYTMTPTCSVPISSRSPRRSSPERRTTFACRPWPSTCRSSRRTRTSDVGRSSTVESAMCRSRERPAVSATPGVSVAQSPPRRRGA